MPDDLAEAKAELVRREKSEVAEAKAELARREKQSAAPSRPPVSTTDRKPSSTTSQFALKGPTTIGPPHPEEKPNLLQQAAQGLGHILGLPAGLASAAAMQPIGGKSLTGVLSSAHKPQTGRAASRIDQQRFAELQRMNIFQRANELSGQSFADPNLGRPRAQGLEQETNKAQFGHAAGPMSMLQHMTTDPLAAGAVGHRIASAAFAANAAAGATEAAGRFIKRPNPDDAIEMATNLLMAHAAGKHAKAGLTRAAPAESPLAKAAAKDPLVAERRKPNEKPNEDTAAKRERAKARTATKKVTTSNSQPAEKTKAASMPRERADATKTRVQPESPPVKHQGDDKGGTQAKTGSRGRVQPAAKVQGKAEAVVAEPPKPAVPPKVKPAATPPAKPPVVKAPTAAPEPSGLKLSMAEANTLGLHHAPGDKLGDALSAARKGMEITAEQQSALQKLVKAKGLARSQFPNLYKESPKDVLLRAKGAQELGTFNPLRTVVDSDRYQSWNENLTKLYRGTAATFNPYSLDPTAQKNALIGKDYMARQAMESVRRIHNLRFVRNAWDGIAARTPGVAARFMFDMEGGNKHADPDAQTYGDIFRKALDDKRTEVHNLDIGALDFYFENYFPHEWKDPGKATRMFGEGRTPFQGSKKFLKERKIPTIEHGMFPQGTPANLDTMSMAEIKAEVKMQGGLEPWSYNPAEMVQHKLQEQDKFITAQKWAAEAKTAGLMKSSPKFAAEQKSRVAAGQPAGSVIPDGWVPLNDKMFKIVEHRKTAGGGTEKIEHGQWYAPEGAARILNNYLSPGFANHPTMGPGYRAIRAGANMLVQAKLGLSGFHWTGESINAMFSGGAKAMQEASRGQLKSAAKSAAMAATGVVTPIKYYVDGKVLFAEAMKPGSQPVRYAAMLDYLMKGGGRLEMPHEFRVGAMEGFAKSFRKMDVVGMGLNTPMAIAEGTMAPLMREAVPKMKLGAFMDMMTAEIDRLGPDASIETQRASAARIWDSVENRFGELTYDNLFFDNYFKDMLHLTTMAPGWNIGSAREGLGAVKDVLTTRPRMKSGGPVLTERTAFALSLAVGTGYLGYIYNKLHGRDPKTLEDLFFPIGPDGKRVQLPTYARDVHGMATDWRKTIAGKAHPGITLAWEFMHGRDYFGRPIKDLGSWFRKSIVPISMKTEGDENELEAMKRAVTTPAGRERLMGITPVAGQGQKKKSGSSSLFGGGGSLFTPSR